MRSLTKFAIVACVGSILGCGKTTSAPSEQKQDEPLAQAPIETQGRTQADDDASTLKKNGTNDADSSAMKTKNGFGAQLWLIDDQRFFEEWNKPTPGVEIKPVNRAARGKPLSAVIIFTGATAGTNGLCDVTGSITVRKPDGDKYGDITGANFWRELPPPKAGELQLGVQSLGMIIEDQDPAGTYTVDATVVDNIAGTALTLTTEFVVDENGNVP